MLAAGQATYLVNCHH